MIVYSDRQRSEDPRILLERLLRGLGGSSPDASALLIEAGMLEAGVVDAVSPSEDCGDGLPARLGAAMLHLALAARGDRGHLASAPNLFADVAPHLPPGPVAVSEPEGFAFYALYPETYAGAARRFLEAERPESTVVVGLRSIGTTLSAVVAAELVAAGIPTERLTVRPRGHPWDRELRLSPDLAANLASAQHVLVVDEGPGISGTSFACVAEAALAAGVPGGRIHLFPSWNCDGSGLRSERARAIWPQVKRWTVSYEETFLDSGRLAANWGGGTLRDLSGGLWRGAAYPDEARWPAVQPQHERRKYLLEQEDGTRLLLKFVGLGERGHRMLARAERQAAAGLAPPVHGLRDGVLALGWLDGSPADAKGRWGLAQRPAKGDAAVWTGAMARHLAHLVAEPMGPERLEPVRFDDILAMTRLNVAEGLGEDEVGSTVWMDRMRSAVEARPAVAVDGRMLPHEWLWTAEGPRKCDGLDHHDDHFWPGTQDIAWDLAGAMVEWGFDAETREQLLAGFEALTGDLGARQVLPFHEAAYLAWRLGYTSLAAETLGDSDDGQRMARDRDVYADLLRAALERGGA